MIEIDKENKGDSLTNKVSPYSDSGIYNAVYSHLISEWKGLSMVSGKKDKLNFPDLLREVIDYSLNKSEMAFDSTLINYVKRKKENRIADLVENNARSIETKKIEELYKNLIIQDKINKKKDLTKIVEDVKEKINRNYKGLNNIAPKGLDKITEDNLSKNLKEIRDTRKDRLSSFKGLPYRKENNFHFIDEISASVVFYNKIENKESNLDSLLKGLVYYVLKTNEIKNTKTIINKVNKIAEGHIKNGDIDFSFNQFDKAEKIKKTKRRKRKSSFHEEEKNEIHKLIMKNKDP